MIWQAMKDAPRDGTPFVARVDSPAKQPVIVRRDEWFKARWLSDTGYSYEDSDLLGWFAVPTGPDAKVK